MNSGRYGEILQPDYPPYSLLVGDTANSRIMGYPLLPHNTLHARFWVFIAGSEGDKVVTQWQAQTVLGTGFDKWFVLWGLSQALGWQFEKDIEIARISDLTVDQKKSYSRMGYEGIQFSEPPPKPSSCSPYETPQSIPDTSKQVIDEYRYACHVELCSQSSVYDFANEECCHAFCDNTFQCSKPYAMWFSALSSKQKCKSLQLLKDCIGAIVVDKSNACNGVPAGTINNATFLRDILGAHPNYNMSYVLSDALCGGINSNAIETVGCGGWCDTKIAEVLGVDRNHLTDGNNATPIYSVLVDMETWSEETWLRWGSLLHKFKNAEYVASKQHNYSDIIPDVHYGLNSPRALFQNVYKYVLTHRLGWDEDKARVAISPTNWYYHVSGDYFLSKGSSREGIVYWVTGFAKGKGTGTKTQFHLPTGMAIDKAQRLYIADSKNVRVMLTNNVWVRNLYSASIIGNGYEAYNGNGLLAAESAVKYPRALAVDSVGVLHFTDPATHQIRQQLGENWNTPCGNSNEYWSMLTNPSSTDQIQLNQWVKCRVQEIKAVLLHQTVVCYDCYKYAMCRMAALNKTAPGAALECNQVRGTCHADLRWDRYLLLCDPEPWRLRPLASLLTEQMIVPPDCEACTKVNGCELPEATMTWNITEENYTDDGVNDTFEMVYFLSDHAIEEGLAALISFSNILKLSEPWTLSAAWTNTGVGAALQEAMAATGVDALQSKVNDLQMNLTSSHSELDDKRDIASFRILLNQGANSSSAAKKLQHTILWHFYQHIVDACLRVVNSDEVDRRALLGAQYYDKMSQIVIRLFWPEIATSTTTTWYGQGVVWQESKVYPNCNFQHPRMTGHEKWMDIPFDNRYSVMMGAANMIQHRRSKDVCCGMNKHICGEGEGPCVMNYDCGKNMVCGSKNCLWDSNQNCCMLLNRTHIDPKSKTFANKFVMEFQALRYNQPPKVFKDPRMSSHVFSRIYAWAYGVSYPNFATGATAPR
jgi:hypothetical protein